VKQLFSKHIFRLSPESVLVLAASQFHPFLPPGYIGRAFVTVASNTVQSAINLDILPVDTTHHLHTRRHLSH
jgi:hypothetical protein